MLGTSAAMANSPSPTAAPESSGMVLQHTDGTVTVNFSGTWLWPFRPAGGEKTSGISATVTNPCDSRFGAGWGVTWDDPNDPGISETYVGQGLSVTVGVGSRGINPLNIDRRVEFDTGRPCGTFVQTNTPQPGDGYVTGTWTATHTYANITDVPPAICVITYDLGFGHMPAPSRIAFSNDDNSVVWALRQNGAWNTTTMGQNCSKLPPAVPAPPTPTPPAPPPPVQTVSHTPTPAPPVHAASKAASSGILAFTGFGQLGQLLALLGAILVLVGLPLYFLDLRRTAQWFLGL